MPITRINHFEAQQGKEEQLFAFLTSAIARVLQCPGSVSCRLLRQTDSPGHFAIIEEWESIEAHQQAAKAIPPEMMQEAFALFAGPPSGAYFTE